jgi:(p)ppGpp synthase/HD superfamily hydrolase
MIKDPIIEEVRKHRDEIAREFGYDIRALVEDARKREKTRGHRLVSVPKRKNRKSGATQ